MFTSEAYVPNTNPNRPITMMAMSFTNHTTHQWPGPPSGHREITSIRGGKMKGRKKHMDPNRLVRLPRSGTLTAIAPMRRKSCIYNIQLYYRVQSKLVLYAALYHYCRLSDFFHNNLKFLKLSHLLYQSVIHK